MPDPTNLEQIQAQKVQEGQRAAKLRVVEDALRALDPTYVSPPRADYLTLVDRLRTVLAVEWATLTGPSPPPSAEAEELV